MKGTVNKVILIGNLGDDPNIIEFDGGDNKVARFPLATTEVYTDRNNQKVENTQWHNIVFRNKLADVAKQYLKKGDKIYVEGKLSTRKWEENGQDKYITEIQASNFTFLNNKNTGATEQEDSTSAPF